MKVEGRQKALETVEPYKNAAGRPDSLVMLSGGRDSCYGLHYAVSFPPKGKEAWHYCGLSMRPDGCALKRRGQRKILTYCGL
jgi:tRNA(Ile)-lysidine synthase TilS/MesJ